MGTFAHPVSFQGVGPASPQGNQQVQELMGKDTLPNPKEHPQYNRLKAGGHEVSSGNYGQYRQPKQYY